MPEQNRVTPMGDVVAIPLRGAWTGNRGIIHAGHQIVRFHASDLWITCVLQFRGRWREQCLPHRWTHRSTPPRGGRGEPAQNSPASVTGHHRAAGSPLGCGSGTGSAMASATLSVSERIVATAIRLSTTRSRAAPARPRGGR